MQEALKFQPIHFRMVNVGGAGRVSQWRNGAFWPSPQENRIFTGFKAKTKIKKGPSPRGTTFRRFRFHASRQSALFSSCFQKGAMLIFKGEMQTICGFHIPKWGMAQSLGNSYKGTDSYVTVTFRRRKEKYINQNHHLNLFLLTSSLSSCWRNGPHFLRKWKLIWRQS